MCLAILGVLVGPAAAETAPADPRPTTPPATPTVAAAAKTAPTSPPGLPTTQKPASPKAEAKPSEEAVVSGPMVSASAKANAGSHGEQSPKNVRASHDDKAAPGESVGAEPDSKAKPKAKAKPHAKPATNDEVPRRFGEGPSPASPPPLTMAGLRDEIQRESSSGAIDPATPARTKVEQMLAEVTKARAALHADTDRLEAMLTANDGAGETNSAGGGPASGAGKPAAKNPLDILAKALRGIKPAEAAPIVSRLDKRLAANVLQRMPPADAGKIMGAMKPDNAAELATQIAMRQSSSEAKK